MGLDWGSLSPGQYFSGKSMEQLQTFASPIDCNKTRQENKTLRLGVNVSREQLAKKQAIDYRLKIMSISLIVVCTITFLVLGKLKACKNDIRDYISRDGRGICKISIFILARNSQILIVNDI